MAQNHPTALQTIPHTWQLTKPDPALKHLEKLVGTWELRGYTLDSTDSNIRGWVTVEWLTGGFFLQQRSVLNVMGSNIHSLEVISYDPSTNTFPSTVYSNIDGVPRLYEWDIQGNIVTHRTQGAKYMGTFNADGNILSGGWRPEKGIKENPGNSYDVRMIRVK